MTAGTMALPALQAERPPVNKWLVTVSITFGTLMGAIDASIVNVAVPHLMGSLGVTVEQITWVTTGFVIATVMVMPLTGFLARLFGQKRVYLVCLLLFGVGQHDGEVATEGRAVAGLADHFYLPTGLGDHAVDGGHVDEPTDRCDREFRVF